MYMKTCKESGLANGLCLWVAGIVASVFLATANAGYMEDHYEGTWFVDNPEIGYWGCYN